MVLIVKTTIDELFSSNGIDKLLEEYANESRNSLMPSVKPDISLYKNMEKSGILDCIAVYDGFTIVGLISAATVNIPHYNELSTSIESFFVMKEYRKHGTAKKMLAMIEELANDRGSNILFMSAPIGSNLSKASRLMGMKPINTHYCKRI